MLINWAEYLAIFIITFVLSVGLTPVFRKIARHYQVLDKPDLERKTQTASIPYLGGMAVSNVFVLFVAGVQLIQPYDWKTLFSLAGILGPALLISLTGLIDDIKGLKKRIRIAIQSFAALITSLVLVISGTRSEITGNAFVDTFLVVLWVVTITNSLNLVDNMDGHASTVGGFTAFSFFVIALISGQYLVAALSLALAGSIAGFWIWNRNPASIYLGDSGSLFIGFILAAISIRINLVAEPKFVAAIAPVIILLFPILDTTLVVISRIRRGLSPFSGGLDHVSHRLMNIFSNLKLVNTITWLLTLCNLLISLLLIVFDQAAAFIFIFALMGYSGIFIVLLNQDHERGRINE